MRRLGRATAATAVTVVTVAFAVLPLASCGGGSTDAAAPSPTTPKERLRAAVLTAGQLPPKWRPAPVRRHVQDPGLPTYCGVTALPKPLSAAHVDLYARTSTGPFLLQYTSVAGDEDAAKAVLAKLRKVAKTCRKDENGEAKYRVRPVTDLTRPGDEAVGFHYETQTGLTSGVVVFRRGDMVVTLVDLGPPAVAYETVKDVAGTVDEQIR